MPAKMERCVRKVRKSGKDKSAAYAICVSSTGIKRKKGGGWTESAPFTFKQLAASMIEILQERNQ